MRINYGSPEQSLGQDQDRLIISSEVSDSE